MVISIVNGSERTGKTTLAIHLAAWFAKSHEDVLLLDTDPRSPIRTWMATGKLEKGFTSLCWPHTANQDDIKAAAGCYKHVVIDTPSHSAGPTHSMLMTSDVILVPVVYCAARLGELASLALIVDSVRRLRPGVRLYLVVNTLSRGVLYDRELCRIQTGYFASLMQSVIHHHLIFQHAMTSGETVLDLLPEGLSAREINALGDELVHRVGLARSTGGSKAGNGSEDLTQ